jgi:hypothetical protein
MLVTPDSLIDGVLRTLEEEVLPDLSTAYARGQLYCVVDVLANLRDRIEPRAALATADADAAADALDAAANALGPAAAGLRASLEAAPDAPPAARAEALHGAVNEALEALAALPDAEAAPAHEALRGYLVGQAVRDVLPLKPSRLGQIAKG